MWVILYSINFHWSLFCPQISQTFVTLGIFNAIKIIVYLIDILRIKFRLNHIIYYCLILKMYTTNVSNSIVIKPFLFVFVNWNWIADACKFVFQRNTNRLRRRYNKATFFFPWSFEFENKKEYHQTIYYHALYFNKIFI